MEEQCDSIDELQVSPGSLRNQMVAMVTRATLTLWRNYYPEGEWGWIVLTAGFLSISVNSGVLLAFPVALPHAASAILGAGYTQPDLRLRQGFCFIYQLLCVMVICLCYETRKTLRFTFNRYKQYVGRQWDVARKQ